MFLRTEQSASLDHLDQAWGTAWVVLVFLMNKGFPLNAQFANDLKCCALCNCLVACIAKPIWIVYIGLEMRLRYFWSWGRMYVMNIPQMATIVKVFGVLPVACLAITVRVPQIWHKIWICNDRNIRDSQVVQLFHMASKRAPCRQFLIADCTVKIWIVEISFSGLVSLVGRMIWSALFKCLRYW